jgi:hypothetical protein
MYCQRVISGTTRTLCRFVHNYYYKLYEKMHRLSLDVVVLEVSMLHIGRNDKNVGINVAVEMTPSFVLLLYGVHSAHRILALFSSIRRHL